MKRTQAIVAILLILAISYFKVTVGIALGIMVVACILIAKACDGFEVAADYLGRNLSDGVKGMSINAIAGSIPEFMTTVFFLSFANASTLGVNFAASTGGDAGSAIFNSVIIPMVVIITVIKMFKISGIEVSKKVILRDGLALLGAEILFIYVLDTDYIHWWHGGILTLYYFCYLGYSLKSMSKSEPEEEEEEEPDGFYEKFISKGNKTAKSWLLLLAVVLVIAGSCAILVKSTEVISEALQINLMFVSLILVAAATSVPDTIISVRDAKKGNYDDAVSNVFGSNIFDISFSTGCPLMIYLLVTNTSIDFRGASQSLVDLRFLLLTLTTITIATFYFSKKMGKKQVIILGLLYALFLAYCIGGAYPSTPFGAYVTGINQLVNSFL